MLYSIVGIDDVFMNESKNFSVAPRSSNPYDYIRFGYCLDVPDINGGHCCVNYNCDFSSPASGALHNTADK